MGAASISLLLGALQAAAPAPPVAPAAQQRYELEAAGLPLKRIALDRRGWTLGGGVGAAGLLGDSGAPALASSLRIGHSINPYWALFYDLEAFTTRAEGASSWHTVHNAAIQWHVTPTWYLRGGLGLGYGPVDPDVDGGERVAGPSVVGAIGWELFQSTRWTAGIEVVGTRVSAPNQTDPVKTAGATLGIQFY